MALSSFFFYCSITFFNRVPYIGHDHSSVYRSAVSFRTTWQRRRTKTLPAFTDTLMQPAAIFFISAHHFRFVLPNISHELVQFLPTTWNQLYHSKLFYFMPYERCAWTLCWCDAKKKTAVFFTLVIFKLSTKWKRWIVQIGNSVAGRNDLKSTLLFKVLFWLNTFKYKKCAWIIFWFNGTDCNLLTLILFKLLTKPNISDQLFQFAPTTWNRLYYSKF